MKYIFTIRVSVGDVIEPIAELEKETKNFLRTFGDDREVVLMNDLLTAIFETPRAFSDEEIQMAKNALILATKTKFRKAEISNMEVVE